MLLEVLACLPLVWLLWKLLQRDPPPLMGVYSQPGRWYYIKYVLFLLMMYWRKRQQQKHKQNERRGSSGSGYGTTSHDTPDKMEQIQPLTEVQNNIDILYFTGMNKDGVYLITHLGHRSARRAEVWLSLLLPDDRFYQLPIHPATMLYNVDNNSYSAGGLKMECLEPMKRWKISYNGLLREGLCNEYTKDKGKLVHVSFSFLWTTFSDVFNFDVDVSPCFLADSIAREPWTKTFFEALKSKHQTHYEQWGELRGTLKIEGHEDVSLYMRGVRDHSYGFRDWRMFHRYVINFGYLEDGTTFHVSLVSWTGGLTYFKTGYVSLPNATMIPVSSTDLELGSLGEHHNPPEFFFFSFTAGGMEYNVNVKCIMHATYYHEEDWGNVVYENFTLLEVNGIKGYGISEFAYRRINSSCPVPVESSLPLLAEPEDISSEDSAALVLGFTRAGCCFSRVVGGKGCQLGLLTQLQSEDFVVPEGFCLTLKAFDNHIKSYPELARHIQTIEDIACGKCSGSLEAACKTFYDAFILTEMAADVRREVAAELIKQFGSNHGDILFAVRSSAAGEDGSEMSAAGQMDTFLGIKGLHQLFEAVVKCWASQFAITAVQYRRQHGQPIHCGMGVVIQKMVSADTAGVLFTCDPLTGNPACMVINANYGLGESVVSGSTEPDMVTITRSWDNELSIGRKQIGRKSLQIILQGTGGVENKDSSEDAGSACCLSDDMILRLGQIGVDLEKRFSNPRDIEFAIKDGIIHLLQARPVTSQDQESDFDIMHEFDSALCHDRELITTANIGEMMPSAMSTLTLSMFLKAVDMCGQMMYNRSGVIPCTHDFLKFLCSYNNMGFINLHMMLCLNENTAVFTDKRVAELSIMGETRDDFTEEEVIRYHGRRSFLERLINGLKFLKCRWGALDEVKKWEKYLESFTIANLDFTSASDLYALIDKEKHKYLECWMSSLFSSSLSATWATVLMAVLSRGKHVWTTQYYSDVAMMLSQCEDVYSADVPSALQNLAESIKQSGDMEQLLSMSAEEAAQWLITNSNTTAGKSFKEFLQRHGHRCVKEAEFLEKSWQAEPHKVISVIQAILSSSPLNRGKKKIISVDETIKKIKTPLTFFGRMVLKWALPRARRAVGHRERGKSVAVKMNEVFKQGYWKLASLMVREGRLPKEELLFFLTHEEIGQLLETRCSRLVTRAQRRYKLYPKQLELKYQTVNRGRPILVQDCTTDNKNTFSTTLELQGMPVSQGIIQAKVRVIRTLEEAASIQSGEILVVPFTDVGWSPYFPLISGLATEMGGLVSHGAVVAREYGLPCIVNAQNATSLLKTGDEVILNGTMGTLKLLE